MDQRNCEVLTTDIEWPHMRVFIYAYLLWITVWSFDFELRGKNDNGFNPPPFRIWTNRATFDIRVYYSVVTTKILDDFETQKFFRSIRKCKLKLIINRKLILFLHLIENSDGI